MRIPLFFILLFFSSRLFAQVGMTVQLPPAGVVMRGQLWNIVLVSGSNSPVNVRIALRITDAQNNQPLLTGITRVIALPRGGKQLKVADVMPVEYEYFSPAIDRNVNGLLPAGSYIACYNLIVEGDKSAQQPGEDCIPLVIEPVSPPLLSSPADKSLLDGNKPMFTWLPPTPPGMFSDLNYEMLLVEVHDGQSAQEAVQQNLPVYRAPRLRNVFANYPSGAATLDTAKTYAWTVVANNGNQFAAQTEVWTFRLKGVAVNKAVYNGAYVQLKRELDGAVITAGGQLQFVYRNEQNDAEVRYEIQLLDGGNKIVQRESLPVKPGENLLSIKLGKRLEENKQYIFSIVNSRKERWLVKFVYQPAQ